jgi:hypothetical protein
MQFPDYWSIDLPSCELKWGYYVPALIEQYRPDIETVDIKLNVNDLQPNPDTDYSQLPAQIESALKQKKKVALLVEDEHVMYNKSRQLTDIVNFYQDYPVYWCTQLEAHNIDRYYRQQHKLKCKIVELPWVILNECLMWDYSFCQTPTVVSRRQPKHSNFFTLTGKYEPFRKTLIEQLIEHHLDQYGIITVQNSQEDIKRYAAGSNVKIEPYYPYQDQPIKIHAKMAAQHYQNGIWQSCNTRNFMYLEKTYVQYPLAIIPETAVCDYFSTEKSVWPILLGKLFLIVGPVGCMKYIQRFYDIKLSDFLDLEFDSIIDTEQKIDLMLTKNMQFILNSHQFYQQYQDQIQAARRTIGPNLYRFVVDQVDKIY